MISGMNAITKKIIVAATVALLLILTTLKGQEPSITQLQVGRFQIADGEYVINVSGGVAEKGVFKIDTATGRTWKYSTGMQGGKSYEMWAPLQ